jgi:hypothetical protein
MYQEEDIEQMIINRSTSINSIIKGEQKSVWRQWVSSVCSWNKGVFLK